MSNNFSKSFCLCCKKEMRKWISNKLCVSMCINKKCLNQGIVCRDIQNIDSFIIICSDRIYLNE